MTVKKHTTISNMFYYYKIFARSEPTLPWLCLAEILLGTLISYLQIYLPKLTLELLTLGVTRSRLITVLGAYTLMAALLWGAKGFTTDGHYHLSNTKRTTQLGSLFLKSLRVPYEYAEAGEARNIYQKSLSDCLAKGDWSALSVSLASGISLTTNVLCFFLYSAVIGQLSIYVAAGLITLSVADYLVQLWIVRFKAQIRTEQAINDRHFFYMKNAMGNEDAAKDIRIFGMNEWLGGHMDTTIEERHCIVRRIAKREMAGEQLTYLLGVIRDLAAYACLIAKTLDGSITVADFVLYFGAIAGFSGFITSIMNDILHLKEMSNETDYLRAYMDLPEEDEGGSVQAGTLQTPLTITFEDVCFSYHFGEEETETIFDHFNLTIHAGEKLALVGVNGAGKTTLVKLLCGMYEPDSGRILINGIDRRELSRTELYSLFSVVFQEPLIFPFSIGENLCMHKQEMLDEPRAWSALEKAGLKHLFEEKKIDMKTTMLRDWDDNGVELSGGQQQRFLLARALYKDAPMLVLDEPTAALDPIAESEVYDAYRQYSEGKTSLFISHRLASTRFSDRIIMLEHGRIIEEGTHEELMRLGGAYAEMFDIQSSYYQEQEA